MSRSSLDWNDDRIDTRVIARDISYITVCFWVHEKTTRNVVAVAIRIVDGVTYKARNAS